MIKKLLIISNAYYILSPAFNKESYHIIPTGPCESAYVGMHAIARYGEDADFILLDMKLAEEPSAGAKIQAVLDDALKAKVISITDEPLGKRIFDDLGITHNPGKNVSNVIMCIEGKCDCGEKKAKGLTLTKRCDILITSASTNYALILEKNIARQMDVKIVTCTTKKEVIKAAQELHPLLVLCHHDGTSGLLMAAKSEYESMQETDGSLPDFETLYDNNVIIVGKGYAKRVAEILGYPFLDQFSPSLLAELKDQINTSLCCDARLELWTNNIVPIFSKDMKDLRDKLIKIARERKPTSAKACALDLTNNDEDASKACRYLAKIRRDYGDKKFEEIVATRS